MKTHDGWQVLTKDLKRTIIFENPPHLIINIKAEEIEELYKDIKKSIKFWKKHNKNKKRYHPKIKAFYKHLNKNTSFSVSFK